MCARRLHSADKEYHGPENQNNENTKTTVFYQSLRSRYFGISFKSWHYCYIVWDIRDLRRATKGPRWFNMKFVLHSKRFEKQNRRSWWSYRVTVEEQFVTPIIWIYNMSTMSRPTPSPICRLHRLQIVPEQSLCHYYPYINLSLCKILWRTNLLQTICSFFLLLFDVAISSSVFCSIR